MRHLQCCCVVSPQGQGLSQLILQGALHLLAVTCGQPVLCMRCLQCCCVFNSPDKDMHQGKHSCIVSTEVTYKHAGHEGMRKPALIQSRPASVYMRNMVPAGSGEPDMLRVL